MSININIQNSRDFNVNTYTVTPESSDNLKSITVFTDDKKNNRRTIPKDNLELSKDIKSLLEDINKKQERLLELSESNRIQSRIDTPCIESQNIDTPRIDIPKIIDIPQIIKSSDTPILKVLNKLKKASSVSAYGMHASEYSASPSDYLHSSPSTYNMANTYGTYGTYGVGEDKIDPAAYARFYQLYEQILAKYNIFDNIDNTLVKDLYSEFTDESAIDQSLLVKELLDSY